QRCARLERAEDHAVDAWRFGIAAPSQGAPTRLGILVDFRRSPTIRVTQPQPSGQVLDRSAKGTCLLLPSSFDVTRPFTVSLTLRAGEYTFDPYVVIGYREPR